MTLHAHFEALYAADEDPWAVRAAWYERRKRALLLASLGKERYRSAFEPGCGNGEMSAQLAQRCERLLACDGAASAVAAARRHLHAAGVNKFRIEQRSLPAQWPRDERFDLVVISELAYYFEADVLEDMLARACAMLDAGGELALCHYLHDFDDRVTGTEAAHALIARLPGMTRAVHHLDQDFLLEVWRKEAP
ncbi:class I SAM-dependent methyltransferase [uncultured Massilia sp.]|uniref:methyltransferase domain-containing protein n=1 Tax=uncultured Massilia sp. TaxID=169973 RepID=UPI002587F334|nr:class I SAM-dependent methyltransferase [uncultured Massilia sp.]